MSGDNRNCDSQLSYKLLSTLVLKPVDHCVSFDGSVSRIRAECHCGWIRWRLACWLAWKVPKQCCIRRQNNGSMGFTPAAIDSQIGSTPDAWIKQLGASRIALTVSNKHPNRIPGFQTTWMQMTGVKKENKFAIITCSQKKAILLLFISFSQQTGLRWILS